MDTLLDTLDEGRLSFPCISTLPDLPNNSNPYMGDKVLISVEISNDGLDNASDVEIESNLPHELNIISHDKREKSNSKHDNDEICPGHGRRRAIFPFLLHF